MFPVFYAAFYAFNLLRGFHANLFFHFGLCQLALASMAGLDSDQIDIKQIQEKFKVQISSCVNFSQY